MINSDELKNFILDNPKLVTRKESKNYPGLYVIKYSKKVFYDALWSVDPILEECRGLVVDSDYKPVIRPFQKVFNYTENGVTIDDSDLVEYSRKVNGFMAGLTKMSSGELVVSTTGSLDSDFVGYAKMYLDKISPDSLECGVTHLFEICHPEDPHIIPETFGAYYLGARDIETGITEWSFTQEYEEAAGQSKVADYKKYRQTPAYFFLERETCTFGELRKKLKECDHEGFMVRSLTTGVVLKLKSPYYLVNKFLARIGSEKLITGIRTGSIKERVDEEYYNLIDHVASNIDEFVQMSEEQRLDLTREFLEFNTK